MDGKIKYCNSLTEYHRLKTREVFVGKVGFGGNSPIRLQSMTTTDTMDTENSIEQAIRMIDAGCELVRFTAPSKKEAENLKEIRKGLDERGYLTPLVADIHFTPNAAEIAAEHVEKVRVNPGNYADKKKFEFIEYTDESYEQELQRIREKLVPLIQLCKLNNRAIRIGTNHGSLSDRIMSRYGDSPSGMVESAMEFIKICEENGFYDLVISMKSSNALVMVQAYRMLAARMMMSENIYPIHLGVTEAGDGEDGRIKSAVGIGTLLEDGIGDTIRVSLTEEPELEIPVARKLAERYIHRKGHKSVEPIENLPYNPYEYSRRKTKELVNIGDHHVPVIIGDLSQVETLKPSHLFAHGYVYNQRDDKWNIKDQAIDFIYTGTQQPTFGLPGTLRAIVKVENWMEDGQSYPLYSAKNFNGIVASTSLNFIEVKADNLDFIFENKTLLAEERIVLLLHSDNKATLAENRRFIIELMNQEVDCPVIIQSSVETDDEEAYQLYTATDLGALLIDGMGDGIMLVKNDAISAQQSTSIAFGILQASRTRISKTEYISCPSCGRTLFDLQETTAKIRSKTNHLKGIKIGIMGCIVNGPGEMADADYGYVGVGKGKINLYKEKEVIKRNIPEEEAVNELIALIDEYGDWIEPAE